MATRFFGAGQPQPSSDTEASSRPSPGEPETAAPVPPDAEAVTYEHRRALLVGNARYTHGKLANPVNDVRLIGNVLRALGFAVTIVEDVDKAGLQAAVIAFCEELEKAGPGAVALFYFAGHGIQHHGSNYLLPVGTDIPSTRYLPALAVPADEILVELTHARRKANVIILDACRNNALPGLAAESRDIMQGLAALRLPPDGVLVAYSTAAGAVAEDGDGRHSPYAEALAQALPSLLEPGKRLHDVFIEAAERVREVTGARQAPALYLQGTLPALAMDDADRERFRTWVFYEPSWPWRRILQHTAAGLAAAAAGTLAVAWLTAYPEMRGLWLHKVGITRSEAYDFACAPPWDKTDRYGLTRADWCARPMREVVAKVKQSKLWDSAVAPGVAASDPKAMALEAGALAEDRPARGSATRARLVELAVRAGRVGLTAPWVLLDDDEAARKYDQRGASTEADALVAAEVRRSLREAAMAGVSVAQVVLGRDSIRDNDAAAAEAWFVKADATDPWGNAAFVLGSAFAQNSLLAFSRPEPAKAARWLATAAAKGHRDAYRLLLQLAESGRIDFSAADRRSLDDRIIALGGPLGALVLGRRLLAPGLDRNVGEAIKQLTVAADADDDAAMETLAKLYRDGAVNGRPEPAEAMRWLERAASANLWHKYRLGLAYIYGLPDSEGRPLRPIAPDSGKAALLEADKLGIPEIALTLAAQYDRGTFGKRDTAEARKLFYRVLAQARSPADALVAENGLRRLATEAKVEETRRLPEIARGSTSALLTAVIYMPIGCSGCRGDYAQLVDRHLARLIRDGIARVEFRDWYPPEQIDAAADASLMIRCAKPEDRMDLVERFMAGADQWTGVSGRGERVERLKRLAAPVAFAPDDLAVCLANEQWREGLRRQSADLPGVFGVNQVPTIILNGQPVVRPMQEQLVQSILAMLPPQIVLSLTGRSKLH